MGIDRIELANSLSRPASDEEIIAAAIEFANGADFVMKRAADSVVATSKDRQLLLVWLESALSSRETNMFDEFLDVSKQFRNIKHLPVVSVLPGKGGLRIGLYRDFRTVRAVLAYAVMLALDPDHEVGSKVCRCKFCKKFFLSKQDPSGGRPSRVYCCNDHMEKYHNSSERKKVKT